MTSAQPTLYLPPRPPRIKWLNVLAVMIALTVVAVCGGLAP